MAEECADDDDAKVGITELRKSVLVELKMHDSFVQVSINNILKKHIVAQFCVLFEMLLALIQIYPITIVYYTQLLKKEKE